MYNEEDYLNISGIQHYDFCRRQWALIHIEQQWSENYLTSDGRTKHNRVHDSCCTDYRNGVIVIKNLNVSSSQLGFVGQCDAVEFIPAEDGISIFGRDGKWRIRPVEYKHGDGKSQNSDLLQVTTQAICLEEMFCTEINEVCLFYFETRKRVYITLTEDVRQKVIKYSNEMHKLFSEGRTPKAKIEKYCDSCSLKDLCLPKLLDDKGKLSVKEYIENSLGGVQK